MASDIGIFISLCFSTMTLVSMIILNAVAGSGSGEDFFDVTPSDISDIYQTHITPAGWAFIIWIIIFVWLALGQLFFIGSFFIKKDGKRIIHESGSIGFFIFTWINFGLNNTWLIITTRDWDSYTDEEMYPWFLALSYVILFLVFITNIIACGIFASNISRSKSSMGYKILNRFILNGYALYTTWTLIASLINLLQAVVYFAGQLYYYEYKYGYLSSHLYLDLMEYGAYVGLGLLVATLVTYFLFENLVFGNSLRWVLTPYLVVIWASSAIYEKKHKDNYENNFVLPVPQGVVDFTLAIIIIACITFAVKMALVAFRSLKK